MRLEFHSLLLFATFLLGLVSGDVYMHAPRGGNNRLDEAGRERNNANRLHDSQNNNRGGVNVGNEYYHPGSRMYIEWTNQHSCGGPNNNCELIFQYACDSRIRDGATTNTIPTNPNQCENWDCDTDTQYGRHESWQDYMACRQRERNHGLFTSNQRLNGKSARFTRQNPAGTRRGLECPEERDYYPYWAPTMWRDIAILTNQPQRCASYRAASQNVVGRWYCDAPEGWVSRQSGEGFIPIDQWSCEQLKWYNEETGLTEYGRWRYSASWGLPAPLCREAPWTRDNHLGNAAHHGSQHADPASLNWTLPDLSAFHPHWATYGDSVWADWASYAENHGSAEAARHIADSGTWKEFAENRNCVLRIRYNISTNDFEHFAANTRRGRFADASATSLANLRKLSSNLNQYNSTQGNANRDPAKVDVWSRFGLTREENEDSFDSSKNGNPATLRQSREYVLKNNPQVNIFGTLLGTDLRASAAVKLQLAINTAQYGRTFQDRSHAFKVLPLPAHIEEERTRPAATDEEIRQLISEEMETAMHGTYNYETYNIDFENAPMTMENLAADQGLPVIHNINVRGKRGNIVQVYPSVEYDFIPNDLHITRGQYAHFQWSGSNTNPRNNAGQGLAGTDRSNVVAMRPAVFVEHPSTFLGATENIDGSPLLSQRTSLYPEVPGVTDFLNMKGQFGRSYPEMDIGGFKSTVERGVKHYPWRFLGLSYEDLRTLAIQDNGNGQGEMSELDDASPYFDLGPRKITQDGVYHYLCTRNNNFSNRSQKGRITVSEAAMAAQPVGWNGGILYAGDAKLVVPTGTFSILHHITMTSTPSEAIHGSTLGPRKYLASEYIHIGPEDIYLTEDSARMRLYINHRQPWYALGSAKLYYAPTTQGPWSERDATFSSGQATHNTRNGGVFAVVAEPHIGGLFGISLAIVLLIGGGVWAYRRRKRGQPLLPGAEDPLNQRV